MESLSNHQVFHIVLTGGPCGGKTSALPFISEKLREMGWRVLVVPEAATLCIQGGITPKLFSPQAFQHAVMNMGLRVEETFHLGLNVNAEKYRGTVVLYDRGIVDNLAYMSREEFNLLLNLYNTNLVSIRDSRYKAVIHMVSAAIGADDYYTLENNTARTETIEQARVLDRKILDAWTDHPHVREIGNDTDFQTKLERVFREVCAVIGEPVPLENERKFLVKIEPGELLKRGIRSTFIEQTYLLTGDENHELRVRKSTQEGNSFYVLTQKKDHGPGKRLEIERILDESVYLDLLKLKDTSRSTVRKTRYRFFYNQQYFEIDFYQKFRLPEGYCAVLEIELTDDSQEIVFPEWISELREVTDDKSFKNSEIAKTISEY